VAAATAADAATGRTTVVGRTTKVITSRGVSLHQPSKKRKSLEGEYAPVSPELRILYQKSKP
jgi:hypothetical protein